MSAIELFRFLGEDINLSKSPPKDILKKCKPSRGPKVQRYWPGKVPEYAKDAELPSDTSDTDSEEVLPVADSIEVENDRRLIRYKNTEDTSDRLERRRGTKVETVNAEAKPHSLVLENDTVSPQISSKEIDRDLIRGKALEYRKQEEDNLARQQQVSEEDEISEQESEGESDYLDEDFDDNDNLMTAVRAKPIFVPKDKRMTVLERKQIEKEALRNSENEKRRLLARKKESKELLIKKLAESELQEEENKTELIDDTDNLDEKEYELWKIRELKRIIRDREERIIHEKLVMFGSSYPSKIFPQVAEVERRRNMTEEERELDNARIDSERVQKAPRGKMRFLQKYYHKGAFFMDKLEDGSEPLYNRDFNAPTAEDCIDRSLLPKVMRVRRGLFGKQGQVKHTHLVDVDTTSFDMPWSRPSGGHKLAGTKQVFDRPSYRKR